VPVARPADPSEAASYCCVEEVPTDAPVRARFAAPHVTYVGSHEGCGCGYTSHDLVLQGIEDVGEAMALLGAMTETERDELLAEQRSRERLRDLVSAALADGPVEIYACWAGDEDAAAISEETIALTWITDRTAPFEEGVHYLVVATAPDQTD
jgi:hypothetical protein